MSGYLRSAGRVGGRIATRIGNAAAGAFAGYAASKVRSMLSAKKAKPVYKKRVVKRRGPLRPRSVSSPVGIVSKSTQISRIKPSPKVRGLKMVSAPSHYVTQRTANANGGFGFQSVQVFSHITRNDLAVMAQRGPARTVPGGAVQSNYPSRFVVNSLQSETTYTNNTTASATMEIYDIVCRRDIPSSNVIIFAGNTYTLGADPSQYWSYGADAGQGNPPTTTAPFAENILGSSPFDSTFFKQYFKVTRRTVVQLAQGASHRHVLVLQPNKIVDNTMFSSNNILAFAGLSQFVMIVVKGLPVSIAENETTCTTALTQINAVNVLRYKFSWVENNNEIDYYVDNMLTPATADIINIGTGLPGAVGVA